MKTIFKIQTAAKISQGLSQTSELVRLVTAGSVDDGKSTLIGRLLFDLDAIYDDQLLAIKKTSQKRGLVDLDLSLLTDGLAAEREQGITIDVAYRYFSTAKKKFVVADVPGHEQYTRNMVTGAANADMAVLIVDAQKGVTTQTKRHLFITSLLGIPHVLIAVNKMDLVAYRQDVFDKIQAQAADFTPKLDLEDLQYIPLSALKGDMVVNRGQNMPWYNGRTILDYLDNVKISPDRNLIDFRLPIQYVIRQDQKRAYTGLIESGTIKKGEEVIVMPSRRRAKIKDIYLGSKRVNHAFAPQSVAVSFTEEIDLSRGEMISRPKNLPALTNQIEAMVCWFDQNPLQLHQSYLLKHTTKITRCSIDRLNYRINVNTLHRQKASTLALNEIGRLSIQTIDPIMADRYPQNRTTGSFILLDEQTNATVAAGIITACGQRKSSPQSIAKNSLATPISTSFLNGLPDQEILKLARLISDEVERRLK